MLHRGLLRDLRNALPVVALLVAVYLLPPDTSLAELRKVGTLRACMPPQAAPFVTGNARMPGIDLDILGALAGDLGLGLASVPVPAMSSDFNPRSWHLTRAACELVAGGIVASPTMRSFLETSPPYAETGWAVLGPAPTADLHGRRIGVLAPPSGLDRIALASTMRAQGAQPLIVPDAAALIAGLRESRFDLGITDKLTGDGIAAREHWSVDWVAGLPRMAIAFGLWKGDLTLKRAIGGGLDRLEDNGTVAAILMRYRGGPAS